MLQAGTFILTLPIPIVVNSFANYYKNRLWRNEVAVKKKQRRKELKVGNVGVAVLTLQQEMLRREAFRSLAVPGLGLVLQSTQQQEPETDTSLKWTPAHYSKSSTL